MIKNLLNLSLAGVIFYYASTGNIYGVHPDLASAPIVPTDVDWILVPEKSDKIKWPIPANVSEGREQWSKVNLSTKTLELRQDIVIPVDKNFNMKAALDNVLTDVQINPQKLRDVLQIWRDSLK